MILSDKHGTVVRIGDVRTMQKVDYVEDPPEDSRYYIEIVYSHQVTKYTSDYCYTDEDTRDADFELLNRRMDALDGIQHG